MADRHNMVLNATITTAQGEPFMDANISYYGLRYDQMVEIEAVLVNGIQGLMQIGQAEAEKRKGSS